MSYSAMAMIRFGVDLGKDYELPWTDAPDDDIESWWRNIHGFKDLHHPYTSEGEYADGWAASDPRFKAHYQHRRKWMEENPLPIDLVSYCHYDCGFTQLVVPGPGFDCDWAEVVSINLSQFTVTHEQREALQLFLDTYQFEYSGEPGWMLSCNYG